MFRFRFRICYAIMHSSSYSFYFGRLHTTPFKQSWARPLRWHPRWTRWIPTRAWGSARHPHRPRCRSFGSSPPRVRFAAASERASAGGRQQGKDDERAHLMVCDQSPAKGFDVVVGSLDQRFAGDIILHILLGRVDCHLVSLFPNRTLPHARAAHSHSRW